MSSETYTVVSTMKNEGPYILDWVAHYKTLGFDHILVCTNDCTDPTVDILLRLQEMGAGHSAQHDRPQSRNSPQCPATGKPPL